MEESLQTISQVSKRFNVSTRMLRYYEEAGLIKSSRLPDYSYRAYDEKNLQKLRQILLLRKLRISVKDIKSILQNSSAVSVINIFEKNVSELDEEISALSTVRYIIMRFITELEKAADISLNQLFMSDDVMLSAVESLAVTGINFKEDQTMENLEKADKTLSKLSDVRILTLPPSTVASAHFIGDDSEIIAGNMIDLFAKENDLIKTKPDMRHFGFNHPNPVDETGYHGYEIWLTIPENMDVSAPLVKKHFDGGLYAAHMLQFGNFNGGDELLSWANQSVKYEFAGDFADQEHMCGLLEEKLNYVAHLQNENINPEDIQIDFLIPIRKVK